MGSPQAIFFDIDGVILESLDVKADAMAKLFADRPQHVEAIVRYHLDNAGVSRYDKFKYYYSELFHEPLSDADTASLDRRFGELIHEEMVRCPFVPGARECLAFWSRRALLFAISGTPEGELREILQSRGLNEFFQAIRGSPAHKRDHIRELMTKHRLEAAQCLFVGDAKADFEAARSHGIRFVQRLTKHCPQPLSLEGSLPAAVVRDMAGLTEWLGDQAAGARKPMMLAHAREPAHALKRLLAPGDHWVYLGRDFIRMRRFERTFGAHCPRVDISVSLQQIGHTFREPFLSYLNGMAEQYGSLRWWNSVIADEDTLAGSLFGDICYLKASKDLLGGPTPPVLIIAESEALLTAIAGVSPGTRTAWAGGLIAYAEHRIRFLARWGYFLLRGFYVWALARKTKKSGLPPAGERTAMIHTWAGDSFFSEIGPNDAYFTVLAAELKKRNWNVVTLPRIYGSSLSAWKILNWLRARPLEFLVAEDFYRPGDYLRAVAGVVSSARLPTLPQSFEGMDITPLAAEARRKQKVNTSAAISGMYSALIERLAQEKFIPAVFIGTFENASAEKPIVDAIRRHMPKTLTAGFQHGLVPAPLMLQNFAGLKAAAKSGVMPDVIVCSSKFAIGVYAREGVPESRLRCGPSLRHLYLLNEEPRAKRKPNMVFVPLSLDPSAAAELLAMLQEAFPEPGGAKFWVKPHPMMAPAVWDHILRFSRLSSRFQVVSGPIGEWTQLAECAVVTGSASAADLALAGLPVVITGRAAVLDYNPLEYFHEIEKPVRSPQQLREAVERMLSLPAAERKKYQEWAEWGRKELISPVSDASIAAFIEPVRGAEKCAA